MEKIIMNWTVHKKNRLPLALSATLLLMYVAGGSRVLAEESRPSETVNFHDLNVGTPEGAQTLYSRIHRAAERVCSDTDPIYRLATYMCAKKAEADAIGKLNLPLLTAYYNLKIKSGNHGPTLIAAR
jgi:UrcA family protein